MRNQFDQILYTSLNQTIKIIVSYVNSSNLTQLFVLCKFSSAARTNQGHYKNKLVFDEE